MKINNKYDLEQRVWLRTDPEQYERMVIAFTFSIGGVISYSVVCGSEGAQEYYECELSEERNNEIYLNYAGRNE